MLISGKEKNLRNINELKEKCLNIKKKTNHLPITSSSQYSLASLTIITKSKIRIHDLMIQQKIKK